MKKQVLTSLLASLLAFAAPAATPARQTAPAQPANAAVGSPAKGKWGDVFVISRDAAGGSVCRAATPAERAQMSGRLRSGERVEIYSGARRAGEKGAGQLDMLQSGQLLAASAGLRIVLHATSRLAANATASDAFRAAANRWEAVISTPITVVLDVDFGPDFFDDPDNPYDPDTIGATASAEITQRYALVRQRLLANAPEAAETTLYNQLPNESNGAVPVELNGATTASRYIKLTTPVGRALGLEPDITNPESVPLFGGDAGIGFNSTHNFDFDPSDGIDPNRLDFDATAVHEIGHALGFTSESGAGTDISMTLLDLFRLRPGTAITATLSTVATARRVMSEGGSQVFFSNRANTFGSNETQLSTGGPDGVGGDGAQSSHWKDASASVPFIGLMDPTLADGVRETMTANDRLAFDTFGYKLAPAVAPAPPALPPASPPANNNFSAPTTIRGSRGALVSDNIDATGQAGEPDPSEDAQGVVGRRSVWFDWTAPATGTATFDTVGSGFDTTLGAYTGSAVDALTTLAQNDDIDLGVITDSRITFQAVAGTTYHVMVNGWHSSNGAFKLKWSLSTAPPAEAVFEFSQSTYTAPEHDGVVGITIKRSGNTASQQGITLDAVGSAGTLTGLGTVTFAPNQTFKSVPVGIVDDQSIEPNQMIGLFLTATTAGAVVGTRGNATLTVTDDDTFSSNTTQFSGAATRTVAEGANQITLTVTRSGNLTQDAFVDYRTSNGTALDTKDYLFAGGTLHFLAGETSKAVTVLLAQDFFDEPDETFQVTLSNPLRTNVVAGAGRVITVTITDDDPAGLTTNPNDQTSEFVTQHYKDFLNRVPDAGGLQFWSRGIESCGADAQCRRVKRVDTSAAFFLSIEFQETGYLVYRMYKAAFGDINPPDVPVPVRFQEFMTGTQEIGRGVQVGIGNWQAQLEANKQAFALAFVNSGRFKAALPGELTPAQFVDALNAHAGNVLTPDQRAALIGEFGGSANSGDAAARVKVLRSVADNPTLRSAEFRKAFVLMQYFGYLRRDPDGGQDTGFGFAGYTFWLKKLNDFNGDFRRAEMVRAFIESIEYRHRFGQ